MYSDLFSAIEYCFWTWVVIWWMSVKIWQYLVIGPSSSELMNHMWPRNSGGPLLNSRGQAMYRRNYFPDWIWWIFWSCNNTKAILNLEVAFEPMTKWWFKDTDSDMVGFERWAHCVRRSLAWTLWSSLPVVLPRALVLPSPATPSLHEWQAYWSSDLS